MLHRTTREEREQGRRVAGGQIQPGALWKALLASIIAHCFCLDHFWCFLIFYWTIHISHLALCVCGCACACVCACRCQLELCGGLTPISERSARTSYDDADGLSQLSLLVELTDNANANASAGRPEENHSSSGGGGGQLVYCRTVRGTGGTA